MKDQRSSEYIRTLTEVNGVLRSMRNSNNVGSGWLLAVGLPAFMALIDPLYVLRGRPPAGEDFFTETTAYLICAAVGSTAAYMILVRTRVDITETHVVLRNPLRDVALPRVGLEVEPVMMGVPRLRYAGHTYTAWGGENTAYEISEYVLQEGLQEDVVLAWRRPDCVSAILVALWTMYITTGFIGWAL